jgi:hypothetical protein
MMLIGICLTLVVGVCTIVDKSGFEHELMVRIPSICLKRIIDAKKGSGHN